VEGCESLKVTLLVLLLIVSCITDVRERKVKNIVTLPCVILGIALNTYSMDQKNIFSSFLGITLPLLVLLPFYWAGAIGAGDIKLLCCIGVLMGYEFLGSCMLYSALIGGVASLISMLYYRNLLKRLRYLFNYILTAFLYYYIEPYSSNDERNGKLPLTLIIAMGTIVTSLTI